MDAPASGDQPDRSSFLLRLFSVLTCFGKGKCTDEYTSIERGILLISNLEVQDQLPGIWKD